MLKIKITYDNLIVHQTDSIRDGKGNNILSLNMPEEVFTNSAGFLLDASYNVNYIEANSGEKVFVNSRKIAFISQSEFTDRETLINALLLGENNVQD